jgi:hypothetical protein
VGVPGLVWTSAENLAPPRFDPWTAQPIASRYTDYAIPAHNIQLLDVVLHNTHLVKNLNLVFKNRISHTCLQKQ